MSLIKCPNTKCSNWFEPTTKHGYTRKFCSRACANSRQFSEETKELKRQKSKAHFEGLSEEDRKKLGFNAFTPIQRKEAAKRAHKTKKENRMIRIQTLPFDELNRNEQRERILIEQENKCTCGQSLLWNGKELCLELDHIDGNREDNTRSNLRLLCPNCHSQTPTYKGRGIKRNWSGKRYTDEEIAQALKESISIYAALKSLKMSTHGNNYKRLKRIIKEFGIEIEDTI